MQKSSQTWSRAAVVAWLIASAACASAPPAVVSIPDPPPAPIVPLDRRVAWVLRLEAQRVLRDPGVVPAVATTPVTPVPARTPDLVALLMDVDPSVRGRAALAIGRVGMSDGVAPLVATLADREATVRAQAAFGLGLLGRAEAVTPLTAALGDTDPLVRGRAAEGLGLVAAQLPAADAAPLRGPAATAIATAFAGCGAEMAGIAPDDETPKGPAIDACRLAIFALARLREFEPLARVVLTSDGRPVSEWWPVAYALQRIGDPKAGPALLHLARSAGVYSAAFALRGAAALPEGLALAQRLAVDVATNPQVRLAAIRALGRQGSSAGADTLLAVLATRGLSTTFTAEAMAALVATRDPRAADALLDRLTDPRPQVRAAALSGAARADPEGFLLVVSSLSPDREWSVRAALATTLGALEADRVRSALVDMTEDQDQRVVGPALAALARVGAPDLETRLTTALDAPDFVVRATAARLLGERKAAGAVGALARAYERGLSDATFDARAAALVALAAIGGEPALQVVRRGLSDPSWPLRWRAAELLRGSGEAAAEPVRPADLRHPVEFFESAALLHPPYTPVAYIETRLGTIEIALNVVEAPLTTANFVALARAGFFNGLRIHRLVPNFVVQTGDPRGDGEGGPGFAIPDELSPLPYGRGTVGMALSWRDTGGSQFFITHSPQPHLDGRYTVFGQVTKGMEVVDQLALFDVIERVRIWDGVSLK